jgi:hypothetical protein
MACEHCGLENDGGYGSGRFCSDKCARSFSTAKQRDTINRKVSEKLQGRRVGGRPFRKGFDPRRIKPKDYPLWRRREVGRAAATAKLKKHAELPWDEAPRREKRRRVFAEQKDQCVGLDTPCPVGRIWLGKPLILEIDHVNGDPTDWCRKNVRGLCPNCHSQTPTFRNKPRDGAPGEIPTPTPVSSKTF